MTIKQGLIIFLCLQLLLITASCSSSNNQRLPADFGETPSGNLVLYLEPYSLLENVLPIFQTIYPDVELDLRYFDSAEEYQAVIQNEMLTEHGPDLILFSPWMFKNIYKVMESGAFLDLEPLFEKDGSIHWEDYQKAVMDTGLYKDKRYVVPLDYCLPLLVTTEEILSENSLDLAELDNFQTFTLEIEKYLQTHPENPVIFSDTLRNPMNFHYYLWSSGIQLVDYKEGTYDIFNSDFRNVLEKYKAIYPQVYRKPMELLSDEYYASSYDGILDLRRKQAVFSNHISLSTSAMTTLSGLTSTTSPVLFTMPDLNGGVTATADLMVGIPATSRNKNAAFALVKMLLQQTGQTNDSLHNIPVLKLSSELRWELESDMYSDAYDLQEDIYFEEPSKKNMAEYEDILRRVDVCQIENRELDTKVMDTLIPYFEDSMTLDECLQRLDNMLLLYLSE